MARKPKGPKDLNRKQATRKEYERILIVCEGEKTEPAYFNYLIDQYKLRTANIEITPANGSDPVSVVQYAKQCKKDADKKENPFDHVYCVFDCDQHVGFSDASKQAKTAGIQLSRSWPCFEYWFLLHFTYERKPFCATGNRTAANRCQSALRRYHPGYKKGGKDLFDRLFPLIEQAKQRAIQASQDAKATGEQNPSTEVHQLVTKLQEIKGTVECAMNNTSEYYAS
jgi:hypothetical protein